MLIILSKKDLNIISLIQFFSQPPAGGHVWAMSGPYLNSWTEIWDGNLGRKCGTKIWDGNVGQKCGTEI